MTTVLAARPPRAPVPRPVARKAAVPAPPARLSVASETPPSALDSVRVKVAADVMAALAAFGLKD